MSQSNLETESVLNYYYIDSTNIYKKSAPHPTQDLISLYNLNNIANSVARLSEDGTTGVKLRKSYKAHISDLPGKHSIIPKERTISPIVFAPDREGAPIVIKNFDAKPLSYNIDFDKSSDTGIPGFDPSNLAIGDVAGLSGTKRKIKVRSDSTETTDPKRRRLD
ncbi:hypothetical protein WICMUC_001768 [Wickerhamomyces mucosus]|uniref:Mediator of RNA polymerase II transcription subunit 19 n=1 Tax=Wickerhamomyces mucosus TaxID=1378264 RepID=A0A9P8PT91_9ASCO|nr:hypothetical protein WICMUC_001768 [Wickerhamomyces mucosus]